MRRLLERLGGKRSWSLYHLIMDYGKARFNQGLELGRAEAAGKLEPQMVVTGFETQCTGNIAKKLNYDDYGNPRAVIKPVTKAGPATKATTPEFRAAFDESCRLYNQICDEVQP